MDIIERLARVLRVSPGWLAFAPLRAPMVPAPPTEDGGDGAPLVCLGVAVRLQVLREERGLSRKALARAAGLTDTAVRTTEGSQNLPTVATVEALAVALDVSPAWLAYGEGPQVLPKVPRRRKVVRDTAPERRRREPAKRTQRRPGHTR